MLCQAYLAQRTPPCKQQSDISTLQEAYALLSSAAYGLPGVQGLWTWMICQACLAQHTPPSQRQNSVSTHHSTHHKAQNSCMSALGRLVQLPLA